MIRYLINRFIYDYNLKSKLYIIIIFITIIPITVLSMLQYSLSSSYSYNNKREDMLASSKQIKILLDSFLHRMVTISDGIITDKTIQEQFLKDYKFPGEYVDRNHILKKEIAPWIGQAFYLENNAPGHGILDLNSIYITFYLSDAKDYEISTLWDFVDILSMDMIRNDAWYKEMAKSQAQLFWRGMSLKKIGKNTVGTISLNRLYKSISTLEDLGVLSVECKLESITKLLDDVDQNGRLLLYLADEHGNIITRNAEATVHMKVYEHVLKNYGFKDSVFETFKFEQDSMEYMVVSQPLSVADWNIVVIESHKDIQQQKKEQILLAVSIGLLCLGLSIALMIAFSRLITERLEALMNRMKNIKCYLEKKNIAITGSDEIALLERQFVEMTGKVNELIRMKVKMERDNNCVKAELLQNQINPHLLYNSLSAIRCMADEKHDEDVITITDKLIRVYKIALNNGNIIVPVSDEVTLTEEYVKLTKKIYNISMECEFDIDPEVMNSYCMKLILQPVVENSIIHGLRGSSRKGYLSISVKKDKDRLHMRVFDNGRGIPKESIEEILNYAPDKNKGFGIYNVNRRIKLYFGDCYGLSISSGVNEYTAVDIVLPFLSERRDFGEEFINC